MADISKELRVFEKAIYGEDVRQSMINAFNAINKSTEGLAVEAKASESAAANSAASAKNQAQEAASSALSAKNQANAAAGSALSAKNQAQAATDSALSARDQAQEAASSALSAKEQADKAIRYASTDNALIAQAAAETCKAALVDLGNKDYASKLRRMDSLLRVMEMRRVNDYSQWLASLMDGGLNIVRNETQKTFTLASKGAKTFSSQEAYIYNYAYIEGALYRFANTTLEKLFEGAAVPNGISLEYFDASEITSYQSFCAGATTFGIYGLNGNKVKNMSHAFDGCTIFEGEIDLSELGTSNVVNFEGMFKNSNLEKIYVSEKFTTISAANSIDMFAGCTKLKGGRGTKYNSEHVDAVYARIDSSMSPGYFTGI